MQKLDLDAADPAVKQFFLSLPSDPEGLELVLEGDVVYKIVGPHRLTGAELDAVLDAGWKRIRAIFRPKSVKLNRIWRLKSVC